MGFIIIIPLGALAGWSIFAIIRWLRRGGFGRKWWRAFGILGSAGLVRELRAAMLRRRTYTADVQPLNADLAPRFFGAGGPRMAEAGVELAFDLTRHSVIGIPGPRDLLKFRRLRNELFALAIAR